MPRPRRCATRRTDTPSNRSCSATCSSSSLPWPMRRANIIRRFSPIGARALISRNRWVRSRALKPFTIPRHRLNTPLALIVLSVTGVLGGCTRQSQIPSQPPRAVRLATVAAPQMTGETLRYSASILPYAQVDLMFRSSGYVTNISQVRGADGRTRDIGTGDYVEQGVTLAHIRREDLQNQVAQAQAQVDQAAAQHNKADQDFQRAKALYSTQSLTKPDFDHSEEAFTATQ